MFKELKDSERSDTITPTVIRSHPQRNIAGHRAVSSQSLILPNSHDYAYVRQKREERILRKWKGIG